MLEYTGETCYTYCLWALKGFAEFRGRVIKHAGETCYAYSLWALKSFAEFTGKGCETCETAQVKHATRTACGR